MRLKFITALILFILTFLFFAFWSDWHQQRIDLFWFWQKPFLLALAASLASYFFRFLRWDFFLRRLLSFQNKKASVSGHKSALIFLSGLATVVTPLRSGEVLKPILVKQQTGVRASKILAAVVFERFTDALAMLLLMAAGLFRFHFGANFVILIVFLCFLFVIIFQFDRLVPAIILWPVNKLGSWYRALAERLLNLYRHATFLAKPGPLLLGIILGLLAWSIQMLGSSYLVARVVGQPFDINWFLATLFIFSFSAALGFGIPLPGGIGITEPTVAGLLIVFLGVSSGQVVIATLLVRFSTLWFGVLIGILAFQIYKLMGNKNV